MSYAGRITWRETWWKCKEPFLMSTSSFLKLGSSLKRHQISENSSLIKMANLYRKRKPILSSQRVFHKGKAFTCLVIVRRSLRIVQLRADSSFKTILISPISLMTWNMIWEFTCCSMASIQCGSIFTNKVWLDLQQSPILHPRRQTWTIYTCIWPIMRLTRIIPHTFKIRAEAEEYQQVMKNLKKHMDLMKKKVGTRDHLMLFLKFCINKVPMQIRCLMRSRTSSSKL